MIPYWTVVAKGSPVECDPTPRPDTPDGGYLLGRTVGATPRRGVVQIREDPFSRDLREAGGALCAGASPSYWTSERPDDRARAVRLCQECPGRYVCLQYAKRKRMRFGVWGGRDFSPSSVTASDAASDA